MSRTTHHDIRSEALYQKEKQNPRRKQHGAAFRTAYTAPQLRLARVAPVPMNQLAPGVTVWAHVPFAEVADEKTRPAVVLAARGREVTLLPITSSDRRLDFPSRYLELEEPLEAGLGRKCAVQLRHVTVDRLEVINISGALCDADLDRVLSHIPTLVAA